MVEYQALYRKYRPQRFADVVGQEHVTATLSREIQEGKVAHAYLFAGPRGTGKTTTARILAKALNCANRGKDGEPCDECESCRGVLEGASMDVIEMDAASHNKVEDVRDIRVSVSTVASVSGAKRIFILDEAHMLTKAAGNALLKTLEEPPDHVHFVLATTEPYKLLDTIRSRSQRFDFHPVGVETLAGYLQKIADAEQYTTAPGALMAVARHAGGSVRDSLSLLEQVAALGGGTVDEVGVRRALGLAGRDAYVGLAEAMAKGDAAGALSMVAELAGDGVDLRMFLSDAIGFFRGVFLTRYAPNVNEIVDEPEDVLGDWRRAAEVLEPAEVLRAIDVMSDSLIKLREGREERLMLELALLKLTRPEVAGGDPATLMSRMEKLEQKLNRVAAGAAASGGTAAANPAPAVASPQGDAAEAKPAAPPKAEREISPEAPFADGGSEVAGHEPADQPAAEEPASRAGAMEAIPTDADLERIWPQLVAGVRNDLGARREAMLREAIPSGVEGATLVLVVPGHLDFHLEQLRNDDSLAGYLSARAGELLGGSVTVEFRSGGDEGGGSKSLAPDAARDGEADEPEVIPDKDSLEEAPADGTDPLSLLQSELGAQVVDDE